MKGGQRRKERVGGKIGLGWPKRFKNKVMSDSKTSNTGSGRGQSFSARSGLYKTKARVEQSRKGPNQRESALDKADAKICQEKYNTSHTIDSIRGF